MKLDQFYTKKEIAKKCYSLLENQFDLNQFFLLEPSAGEGSFSDLFHKSSLALDIDPKKEYIKKQDFLTFKCSKEKVFVIGNPPFGKNSSLAIQFFNKASQFADYIAFIVPRTFFKPSVTNRLNLDFHLKYDLNLPLESFYNADQTFKIPCSFQVWEKRNYQRKKIETLTKSKYFKFVKKNEANYAIRRVGVFAGKLFEKFDHLSESSHYYIQCSEEIKDDLKSLYSLLNKYASFTAGNPSLSKHDLITVLHSYKENE